MKPLPGDVGFDESQAYEESNRRESDYEEIVAYEYQMDSTSRPLVRERYPFERKGKGFKKRKPRMTCHYESRPQAEGVVPISRGVRELNASLQQCCIVRPLLISLSSNHSGIQSAYVGRQR